MPPRRLFHTSLSPRTFLHNSRLRRSLLDLPTCIIPRGLWLHLLRTMFSAPRVPGPSLRYFLTRLCRRLCTASHLTMPPHNNRSRSSLSGASSPMTPRIARSHHRHMAMPAVPHFPNPLTSPLSTAPAAPAMPATVTCTLRPHMSYCSHHGVSRSMPFNSFTWYTCLKRHRCDLVCAHLSQSRTHSHMSVPHPCGNTSCALSY